MSPCQLLGKLLRYESSPYCFGGEKRGAHLIKERMTKANAATGKLGQQLAEQKKKTHNDTLKAVSTEEQGHRNAQSNAEARNWN